MCHQSRFPKTEVQVSNKSFIFAVPQISNCASPARGGFLRDFCHTVMKLREIIRLPRRLLWALVMEGKETTQMLKVFARHGSGKLRLTPAHRHPTPEELRTAVEQLKDIPRFLPFFVIIVVPLPGVTEGYALAAVTLEKWLGQKIRLLPSQFRHVLHSEKKE